MTGRLRYVLAAGIGSGCGSVARWLLAMTLVDPTGGFPWATLVANVLGSFLIGILAAFATKGDHWLGDPAVRQFLMVGFCGGLTTFSIFSLEVLALSLAERPVLAILYITTSIVLWIAAAWLGYLLGQRLGKPPRSAASSS